MAQWEGVREFVAVVESGGFTAAAERLHISVAKISRQVAALEERLSTELLHRTTRKISVTEAGQIYYQRCRPLLDGLEEAELALSSLSLEATGLIRLTAPFTFGEGHISPLLNDFQALHPQVKLECQLTNQQLDLIEGGFDLAIRLGKLEDSSMQARRLASRQLFLCASPEYLNTYGQPHSLGELQHHNCLLGTLDYWRFREGGQERALRVSGNLRTNGGLALVDAALKGLGLVQLPDYYVRDHIESGKLVELMKHFQPEEEGIWALYPRSRHLPAKVRLLVDFLVQQLQPEPTASA
ncbi:LysR substrate-binding domain-containing protein [Reinekea marinisedimentorum]|uniref:DNA-binding transcriptional LysR family regulator n=1 Tax=Reinekea marinisedimentorum TaxID=230495 RepID=A0A4R3I6P6_9GAMM|nr:LysR substrate-binding domain-containing protein [Reinekea marinisedimentorum]TCS41765.1 DNA-binding transcriptional LysR family regulator [Reinekea marinisedimentorum]